jgi:hypothetical protein
LCLDWCACRLLCYGLVRIKLISSRCLWELWYACMIALFITLLCIHTYVLLHLLRYARYNAWRMWCWSKTRRRCLVDPSRRWKNPQVHTWSGDVRKMVQANLTELSRIPDKPRSIIRLPTFQWQILYMCYMYCCITYRSWVKTLLHQYHSLSRYMNP